MRLCCDYQKLKAKTVLDRHPPPCIQNIIDGLGDNQRKLYIARSKETLPPARYSFRLPEVNIVYYIFYEFLQVVKNLFWLVECPGSI